MYNDAYVKSQHAADELLRLIDEEPQTLSTHHDVWEERS